MQQMSAEADMDIEKQSFEHLIGNLPGFSAEQIELHIHLYEGYVTKLNEIRAEIARVPIGDRKAQSNFSYGAYAELKRREAIPYNGARLHELYFGQLDRRANHPKGDLDKAIRASCGDVAGWKSDLAACAEAATNGWVLLTYDRIDGRLHHNMVFEHSHQVMVAQEILLAFDVWEHAFAIDFGTDKEPYLQAFLANVDWQVIAERLADAMKRKAAGKVAA
jgi:Fe-Mn family superoxide dismutase